jgi:hypothetical protein
MAVEGIGNLVQNVADHLFRQGPAAQATAHVLGARDGGDAPPGGDTFTPSTQSDSAHTTTQDAGIFQVSQGALTEVTANILFVQTNSGTDQIAFPAQNATGAAANLGAPVTVASAASGAEPNSGQAAANPADSAKVQNELQALNAALPALGLTNNEIREIDRIATLIKNFNPAAYADLVRQFEALAQQASQQGAANGTTASGSQGTAGSGSNSNQGGFQVQEILIHFTDVQGTFTRTATSGGGQGTSTNQTQFDAASLQVERVRFTLTSGSGQTVQVQAPQQTAGVGTRSQPTDHNQAAAD